LPTIGMLWTSLASHPVWRLTERPLGSADPKP
jgi:hypothetical protein